jgi:probable FeS assembly SUF system protein SufT
MAGEIVLVKRDVEVITIPYGTRTMLPAGSQVRLAQAFGGNYTVVTDQGTMVRVDAQDADAIGELPLQQPAVPAGAPAHFEEKLVWEQLKQVYDPEIPVNVVDLGLIYGCDIMQMPDGRRHIEIRMTMTAPGCGMGDVLKADVERRLSSLPEVAEVRVAIGFDPPWNMSRLSESAKLQLGLL